MCLIPISPFVIAKIISKIVFGKREKLLHSVLGIWKIMDPFKNATKDVDPLPINIHIPMSCTLSTKPAQGTPETPGIPGQELLPFSYGEGAELQWFSAILHIVSWLPLGDSVLWEITEGRLKWWNSSQQESSRSNTDNKQDLFHLYGWYLFFYLRTFIWTYFPFHFQSAYESFSVIILEVWKFGITVLAIILLGWIFSTAINLRKQ